MTSSTVAGSSALPSKSQSPAEPAKSTQSVHSPPDSNAPSAPTSRPPSAASLRTRSDAPVRSVNGDNTSDAADAQDESEAETDILSAPESSETEGRKKPIKRERSDGPTVDSIPTSTKARLSAADADAMSNTDIASGETNGIKRNGVSSTPNGSMLPPSPKSLTQSKKGHDRDDSRRSPSIGSTASPTLESPERTRASSATDVKKRKVRDDSHSGSVEPPRQRHRLDGPPRVTTTTSSRTQPTSPTSPATSGGRAHKRSASTQSNITTSQKRKRRELSTAALSSHDKKSWHSDSSSDVSSSPRPPPVPHLQPHVRNSRSSQRALTSPARATMPKKNTDRFGATRLARECERGDLDAVKTAYDMAPDELNLQDFAGYSPLQKAALRGYTDVVDFLLQKKCRLDLVSSEGETPLIDAVENGHLEVVLSLLAAGMNPHHQNKEGRSALDVLPEDADNAAEIEKALRQAMREHENVRPDDDDDTPSVNVSNRDQNTHRPDILYLEPTRENLRKYAAKGDALAVDHFLSSIEPDNESAIAAARGGHEMVLNLILASSSSRLDHDPDPAKHVETPMLTTIGRGHLGVIRLLLDQDNFNPTRRTRDGLTYYELAESRRGPRWQQERDLLKERFDAYRTRHPQKSKKRAQQSANLSERSAKHGSKEPSSSPKALQKTKIKAEASEGPIRQRRLISAKDRQERDSKVRRRAVISDDDSSAVESEISKAESEARRSTKVRSPDRKRLKLSERRKSDVHDYEKERAKLKASKRRPSSSPTDLHKSTQDRNKIKLRPESPILDEPKKKGPHSARARADLQSTKDQEKENRITHSPPITKSPEPIRDETPEAEREARRLEAERKKAEAEKAEKARQEAERARLEAERAEAEARRKREEEERIRKAKEEQRLREEAEERRRKEEEERARQARIEALPLPVRKACLEGMNRSVKGSFVECGIAFNFTPIHVFKRTQIEPGYDETKDDANELWMFSHQAIGVLGLPDPDISKVKPEWTRKEVSQAQREFFVNRSDPLARELAQEKHWTYEGEPGFDAEWTRAQIAEGKRRFLAMQPLSFLKFAEFEADVRKVDALRDLDLRPTEMRLTPAPRKSPMERLEHIFKIKGVKTPMKPAQPAFGGPGGTIPLGRFIGVHGPDGPGGTPTKLPVGFEKEKGKGKQNEKEKSVEVEKDIAKEKGK